jgi:hypothetical protein
VNSRRLRVAFELVFLTRSAPRVPELSVAVNRLYEVEALQRCFPILFETSGRTLKTYFAFERFKPFEQREQREQFEQKREQFERPD